MPAANTYPPPAFAVYGLDGDRTAARWLSAIHGSPDELYGVSLAHGNAHPASPGESWAVVTSLHLPAYHPHADETRRSKDAAYHAITALISSTQPKLTQREQRLFTDNMLVLSESEAAGFDRWPTSTWFLDSKEVRAHIFNWANAWGGFALRDDLAVIVLATQINPESLRLAIQNDSHHYHVDLRQQFVCPDAITHSQLAATATATAAVMDHKEPQPWPRHPDHLRLLVAR